MIGGSLIAVELGVFQKWQGEMKESDISISKLL